jgi:hypothetical protein
VITTINAPTQAVEAFAQQPDWETIVVGDRKTPDGWSCDGATFLAVDGSREYRLAGALPFDHYSRKMLGYLDAVERGFTVIADSDDDNIPRSDWDFPQFEGDFQATAPDLGWVNVYAAYTDQEIWPRGFPLRRLTDPTSRLDRDAAQIQKTSIGVWQGLADGDPDVDAIYRLTRNTPCTFDQAPPLVLGRETLCPINSQNTAFRQEVFPLLYLPAHVSFRFTDILRGIVAQPILWAAGLRVGFCAPLVFQERNEHDFMRDFEQELPCYLQTEQAAELVCAAVSDAASVTENLRGAYAALTDAGITVAEELAVLDAWLADLESAGWTPAVTTDR